MIKRMFVVFGCVVLGFLLLGCGPSVDDAERFLADNPEAQLVPCVEIHRELREKKRTKRDQLEMTLVPISSEGWTDENLTYTLMREAIDEQVRNRWYVVVVNINACEGDAEQCPAIGRAVYIPDGKGYAGQTSSDKWHQLSVYMEMLRALRGPDFFDRF